MSTAQPGREERSASLSKADLESLMEREAKRALPHTSFDVVLIPSLTQGNAQAEESLIPGHLESQALLATGIFWVSTFARHTQRRGFVGC